MTTTDDTSTPGLQWRKRKNHKVAYWICRPDVAKRGYRVKSARLWAGIEPSEDDLRTISAKCLRLQSEMRDWFWSPRRRIPSIFKSGKIYFIGAGDKVKIGYTIRSGSDRLAALQTGSSESLSLIAEIPGTQTDEKILHKRFDKYHSHGEWFFMQGRLHHYLQTIATEHMTTATSNAANGY